MRLTSVQEEEDLPVVMNVNRPFLFGIVDNSNDQLLFAGKIIYIK